MALQDIIAHQYDWLVKPRSHQTWLQHNTISSISVSGVSLDDKHGKLEQDLKQVFDLVGFQFSLKEGKVTSALERWQTLNANPETSPRTPWLLWQLMPLIGLLTAIE